AEERLAQTRERRVASGLERRHADERLETLLTERAGAEEELADAAGARERAGAEEELADAAGARERATATLYRLRSAAERIGLRREAGEALQGRLQAA